MSNLTPKEKAEELVLMFKKVPMGYGFNSQTAWTLPLDVAKLLALRCVDELIKATVPLASTHYWERVKKEIKLYE